MCTRWKKCQERYSKAADEKLLPKKQEADHAIMLQQNEEYKRIEFTCQQEIATCQEELYD